MNANHRESVAQFLPRHDMIKVKRVYEPAEPGDGTRVLADRLWPRGIKKEAVASWARDVAPSDALRRRFHHDPDRWKEFQTHYFAELDGRREALQPLLDVARRGTLTLVYAARDEKQNNAVALKNYLDALLKQG